MIHRLLVTHYYPEHKGGIEIVAGELAERFSAPRCGRRLGHQSFDTIAWERSATRIPMPAWNFSERFLGSTLLHLGSVERVKTSLA